MELWSPEHAKTLLPAVCIMILVAAVLRHTIGKKDIKIRMIPFQILAAVLFLIEIGKQVGSLARGYDLYHLPFHFCSLFIFLLPLMAFYRGKHLQTVKAVTSAVCASVFLLLMIYPCLIYSAGNINEYFRDYFSFHTVTYHNIVVFEFILIVALRLHEPAPKGEVKASMVLITVFCIVSASMAQILKTNYANYYSCNIPPLEAVRVSLQSVLGYGLTQTLYILIVSALNLGFVYMSYWFYRLVRRLCAGKMQPV